MKSCWWGEAPEKLQVSPEKIQCISTAGEQDLSSRRLVRRSLLPQQTSFGSRWRSRSRGSALHHGSDFASGWSVLDRGVEGYVGQVGVRLGPSEFRP